MATTTETPLADSFGETGAPPATPAKTPPKDGTPKKTTRKRGPKKSGTMSDAKLRAALMEMATMLGVAASAANPVDGQIMIANAQRLTESWMTLAKKNPTVKAQLIKMATVSEWGTVLTATAAVVLPIMANHGLAPVNVGNMMLEGTGVELVEVVGDGQAPAAVPSPFGGGQDSTEPFSPDDSHRPN